MEEVKRVYKHKCKSKLITFYKKDKEILDFANTINFQAFVKNALKEAYLGIKDLEVLENIEFINHLLKNCIIIDKNKLLSAITKTKLSDVDNLTDTYKYSLSIERTIRVGKHQPNFPEDEINKEIDRRVYQEFIKYFEEHLGVSENDK